MPDPEVDTQSASVAQAGISWPMIDALIGGTFAMRAAGEKYLPKFPAEDPDSYKTRLGAATLFPSFSRTSEVLASKPFSRPLSVTGVTPDVEALFVDVDMEGTALQPFFAHVMTLSMRYGIAGVLVDVPPNEGLLSVADEKQAGIRPYMAIYSAATILGWRSKKTPQGDALTQLRLLEFVEEDDGPWLTKLVRQVRVLTPGKWEVWRKLVVAGNTTEVWTLYKEGPTSLPRIPFVFFYGKREMFGIGTPPLLELAHMNVEHYQSSSDQRTILHVARVPILFAKGFDENDKIIVGAANACRSNKPDAELSYVEHTGAAIESGRQSIQDLEDAMKKVGAELLVQRPQIATATQVTSDSEGNRSTLQKIAEAADGSIESCIALMGEWMKQSCKPIVKVFKDFGAGNIAEKGGDMLLRAAHDDHISSETVFNALQRADVLPQDITWKDEVTKLDEQPRGKPVDRNMVALAAIKAGVEKVAINDNI
jgi:hypothetical protein